MTNGITMRINASPIQTYINGTVHQDRLRQEPVQPVVQEQEQARPQVHPEQADHARRVTQQREIVAVERGASAQRQHHYYPFPDHSGLPTSQQKALQTYSHNQNLSRVDSNGDFLGSVDVFA